VETASCSTLRPPQRLHRRGRTLRTAGRRQRRTTCGFDVRCTPVRPPTSERAATEASTMNDALPGAVADGPTQGVPVRFILEQHLGHRTYAENLLEAATARPGVIPEHVPVTYRSDLASRAPK